MIGSGMEVAILRIWIWKHALEGCILGSDKCEECTIGEIPHAVVHWAIKYYECGNISSKIRNLNTHKSAQDDRQMRGMHYWGNPQRWALRLLIASKDRRGSKAYLGIIWHGIPHLPGKLLFDHWPWQWTLTTSSPSHGYDGYVMTCMTFVTKTSPGKLCQLSLHTWPVTICHPPAIKEMQKYSKLYCYESINNWGPEAKITRVD